VSRVANIDQYEVWNGESGRRWVADHDRRDRAMEAVSVALLGEAGLVAGESVLDVGCGCGATSIAAARAVTPAGTVVGIDLSAPMLQVARDRAEVAGVTNVSFEFGDAQVHDISFDAFDVAISRFGTMFFADPVAAFANIAGALRPGARLCVATWQPLAANDWLTIPGAALLRYGSPPPAAGDGPGMFAQSDPAVIARTLAGSGFAAIAVEPVTVSLALGGDVDDAVDYLAATGVGRALLDTIPAADRPAALDAVGGVLADDVDDTGVHLDAAVWITTASRR